LSEFRDSAPQKALCWMPKRLCDTAKCEVAVAMRVLADRVVPVSFQVPRRSDAFQSDLYPDAFAGIASNTAAEWAKGVDKGPVKRPMNPNDKDESQSNKTDTRRGSAQSAPAPAPAQERVSASPAAAPVAMKSKRETPTVAELEAQLRAAHEKIALLEQEIAMLKGCATHSQC
jgi:coronin-1B/1C/6